MNLFIYSTLIQNFHHMMSQSVVKETKWIRCLMEKSAKLVGEDWEQDVKYLTQLLELEEVQPVPKYFEKPLHGFKNGGNCAFQALYQSVSMRQIMRVFQFNSYYREESMMLHLNHVRNQSSVPLTILDIGCGSGDSTYSCNAIENVNIIGSDLSKTMIELAKLRYPTQNFEQMDAAQLNYENNSVDVITCFAMFHEMPQYYSNYVLREFARVLKPNGMALIWDQKINQFSGLQQSYKDPIEPFLESYAHLNITDELQTNNFTVEEFDEGMFRVWRGQKKLFSN